LTQAKGVVNNTSRQLGDRGAAEGFACAYDTENVRKRIALLPCLLDSNNE